MTYHAETPRLWLERLSEKHLQDFHLLWSSEKSMLWSAQKPMQTIAQSREFMKKSLISVYPEIDKFGIMLKPESTVGEQDLHPIMIGLLGTKGLVEGYGVEIAYMLHCEYWNKGYMAEALVAFAGPRGIFWDMENRMDIDRLVAMIDEENLPSIKTIAKVGGKRGERIVKEYGLASDQVDGEVPEELLRDVICWYVDRPRKPKAA